MSFKFTDFVDAMAKLLPVVGEAVITLHKDNPNEAFKIGVGVDLIQAAATILHQSAAPQTASTPSQQ